MALRSELSPVAIARQEVKWPAIGLIVTAMFAWFGMLFVVPMLAYHVSQEGSEFPDELMPLVIGCMFAFPAVMLVAGLMMKRLEAYWLAILGSVLAMVTSPGSLIGFPIGIWSLVVLSRKEIREAFPKAAAKPEWLIVAKLAFVAIYLTALGMFFRTYDTGHAERSDPGPWERIEEEYSVGWPTPWYTATRQEDRGFRVVTGLRWWSWSWLVAAAGWLAYYGYLRIRAKGTSEELYWYEKPGTHASLWIVLALLIVSTRNWQVW